MGLADDKELAECILTHMPNDEHTLSLKCGTTREHVASICTALHKARRIRLDRSWDVPRHWKAA